MRARGEFLFGTVPRRTCLGVRLMQSSFVFVWVAVGLAAALAAAVVLLMIQLGARLPQAHPNARTMHDRPVPRVGGLAIWAGFLPVALVLPAPVPGRAAWLAAWAGIAFVSLIDDWRGVRAWTRLAVHAIAAAIAAGAVLNLSAASWAGGGWLIVAAAACPIVWCANLYNFMDGSDGLAAAMTIFGFGAYGVAAILADFPAEVYFALAAAALPLLVVNTPPARMFMGDVGAVPAGFLAGIFGLGGCVAGTWPAWFPLLVFLPFAADATLTLLQRHARGEPLFEAHRVHYYQRLNRLGAGHRGTFLVYGTLMAGTTLAALGTLWLAPAYGWGALCAAVVVVGAFFAGIDYHWNRRRDSA
jgi:UDP-N-acetylmuramyl pentapeptide phosphotransferase/UDP-N-acetylglucosamine-1-phosphate transferase